MNFQHKITIFLPKTATIYPITDTHCADHKQCGEDVAFSEAILFRNKEVA